jgi:hypothetical protein
MASVHQKQPDAKVATSGMLVGKAFIKKTFKDFGGDKIGD